MRILLIGNQSNTIILFRKRLIEKLVSLNHEVITFTMDNDPTNFEKIKSFGATPYLFQFSRSGMNPVSDLINTFRLARTIKSFRPDVVFSFFPKPVIFGTLASKLAGVKKIYSLLEGLGYCFTKCAEPDSAKKKIVKKTQVFLYKLALPLATKVMFLNKDDSNELLQEHKIKVKNFEVIGGIGVDLKNYNFHPVPHGTQHFTMVSRLLIEKGVREYVKAATIVKMKYPFVRFSIAGAFDDNPGGIPLKEYQQWIREGNIEFLGQISDIKNHLIQSTVFVLPSYREGVPKSTQEAMAIGRAIITTDVPGCKETLVDNYNGFIVPPWDADKLAECMMRFIEQPEILITMGQASRKIAETEYDEEIACGKLISIITA